MRLKLIDRSGINKTCIVGSLAALLAYIDWRSNQSVIRIEQIASRSNRTQLTWLKLSFEARPIRYGPQILSPGAATFVFDRVLK